MKRLLSKHVVEAIWNTIYEITGAILYFSLGLVGAAIAYLEDNAVFDPWAADPRMTTAAIWMFAIMWLGLMLTNWALGKWVFTKEQAAI